jgi:hypothetical protein
MTNRRINIQLSGKVYFTGNLCCIGNCCDDEMLASAYLSLHSPPLSVLWRVRTTGYIQNSGSASQANGHSCFAESNLLKHLCLVTDQVYNIKFRQNQFSKNGPDTRLQTDGNDINNRQCFRILRSGSRKRPMLSIMIQNVVGIMFAV